MDSVGCLEELRIGDCKSMQLIDGEGNLNVSSLDDFINKTQLFDCGYSYSIVSIIGPQSSGKSTLINNLFETNFKMMDSDLELSQTTKGVWMAKCNNVKPFTIVMDIEGTDGRERKDDTTFEKQSALFAFAVSDIVMINMYWKDVGKMHGGCKHLLKTVFQHMVRFFDPRKTTLLFVLRDKANLGSKLEGEVLADMTEIWDAATKGTSHEQTDFSDYFNVETTSLAYYEGPQFKIQVENLRERFSKPISRRGGSVVPALGFSFSVQNIWKIIQQDQDLQLPAHGELVSSYIFTRAANELLNNFTLDERWVALEQVAQSDPVEDFGAKAGSIRDDYLEKFDKETGYITGKSKAEMRQRLRSGISELVQPVVQKMLNQLHITVVDELRNKIDDTLKTAKEPNEAAESLVQSCLDKFSKSSEGLIYEKNIDYFSKTYRQFMKEVNLYAQSRQRVFLSEQRAEIQRRLIQFRSSTFNQSKNEIDAAIDNAEDPSAAVKTLTKNILGKFKKTCEDLAVGKYDNFVSEMHVGLENDITTYANFRQKAIVSQRHAETQKLLVQLRSTTFDESKNEIDSALGSAEDPAASVRSLAQFYVNKFEKSSEGIKNKGFASEMRMGLQNDISSYAICRVAAVMAERHCENQVKLNQLRNTTYNESKNEMDGLLENSQDSIEAVKTLIQYYVAKFDESCEGILFIKDKNIFSQMRLGLENDMKLYAISRQKDTDHLHSVKFKLLLTELRSTTFNGSKGELDSLLNTGTDPNSAVISFINCCLKKFDESCEGYSLKDSNLLSEMRLGLENDIKLYAYMHLKEKMEKESFSMDPRRLLSIGIAIVSLIAGGDLSAILDLASSFFNSTSN